MCNEYSRKFDLDLLVVAMQQAAITLGFPESRPNLQPLDSVRITDPSIIVRAAAGAPPQAELITRRWSWPGPSGKPVYNYRGEGREFRNSASQGRCLIPADGFYEFTAPADPTRKRKDKWLFRWKGEPLLCIAGLWKRDPGVGEAFTMLTCEPGPDIAPYHSRQVALLPRAAWAGWLDGSTPAREAIGPLPAGTLSVEQVG
ncbi:SOS response-associated peptidase [Rhizorhabdus argentea]|uniref:SOS response-associated peptidase n=1 Tax=Rhizorhabdus argentea TaxID=1387174 RepID=UPI0030ED5F29